MLLVSGAKACKCVKLLSVISIPDCSVPSAADSLLPLSREHMQKLFCRSCMRKSKVKDQGPSGPSHDAVLCSQDLN